jgi:hypothetical protein
VADHETELGDRFAQVLRLAAVIDHIMVAVETEGPEAWVVAMRDVSDVLFADSRLLSRAEVRRILAVELHAAFRGGNRAEGVAPLAALYRFLSPEAAERFSAEAEVPRLARRGWERFAGLVSSHVATAVGKVHQQPEAFAGRLLRHPCTLVHGDLKKTNLGFLDDRVVVLDWGAPSCWAPPAVDFAWFLAINGISIEATYDELLDDIREEAGADHDEAALSLTLLGALAQLGWEKALGATEAADEAVRRREPEGVPWWSERAREAASQWPGR